MKFVQDFFSLVSTASTVFTVQPEHFIKLPLLTFLTAYLILADALLLFERLGIKLYSTNKDVLPENDSYSITFN